MMKVLRIWLLGIVCLSMSMMLMAQEEYLAAEGLNLNETLEHRFGVSGGEESVRRAFAEDVLARLTAEGRVVKLVEELRNGSDVWFVLGEDAEVVQKAKAAGVMTVVVRVEAMKKSAEKGDATALVAAKDWRRAARRAAQWMEARLYRGMAPRYSTIFENGVGGYAIYRIPSVVTAGRGRVVGFAEGRMFDGTDCAENDIVARVSEDGGRTWGEMIVVAESGKSSLNNPTAVYVEELDRIVLIFQEYPPKLNEGSAASGFEGERVTRTYVTTSNDGGQTWSARREITREVKQPEATGYAAGPGVAIRVVGGPYSGRIVLPLNVSGGNKGWYNYLIYSDDCGDSWAILPGRSSYGTNESQVVQVSETDFWVNARCHRFEGTEEVAPAGWNPWNFARVTRWRAMIPVSMDKDSARWGVTQVRTDMPDPLCQGCIFRYSGLKGKEQSRILFSNPASQVTVVRAGRTMATTAPARINGTVRVSYDEGRTWAHSRRIYGGRFTEFQYSALTRLADGRIGCIFETLPQIRFAVFDMKWLTSGEDR